LQDIAARQRTDDAVGNDVEHEVNGLVRRRLLDVVRHRRRVRFCGKAMADLEQIAHGQADHQSKGRDDLEIDQRLDADPTDLLGILDMRYARYNGAEDDRRDHHLDQLDEAVTERLDPVIGGKRRPQPADHDPEHDREQNLDIKNFVPGFCRVYRCCSYSRWRHLPLLKLCWASQNPLLRWSQWRRTFFRLREPASLQPAGDAFDRLAHFLR